MSLSRRSFFAVSSGLLASGTLPAAPADSAADVLIVGGGTGGVAAALAACRGGAKRVVMTEETAWVGGQLTSQLVPPDENQWIESGGATKAYRDFREGVRRVYRTRKDKPLKQGADRPNLNPGNGWVSRLCHEPKVGLGVLEEMLKPLVASGQLTIHRHTVPTAAGVKGDAVESVSFRDTRDGGTFAVACKYVIDATEEGDLLPLAGVEFVSGSEARADTGEPNASEKARPGNVQSFTWCFVVEHVPGEHVIEKPKEYDAWKAFPGDGGRPLFNWEQPAFSFYPLADKDPGNPKPNFWTYRRVVDAKLFGGYAGDVSVVNWHQNDYTGGSLHASKPEDAARHRERAKQQSLSLLYWLQTECPRSDGKVGWPGLRPCPDQSGTPDGLAMAPYIRESRRIIPLFRIIEQHVSRPLRLRDHGGEGVATAEAFKDSVGVGHYLYMDLHQTCEGEKKGGWKVFPFQIPLGALVPKRVTNLLAGCKNLGVTHLTNGCYRLHPVEWNVGESAGAAAAFCLANGMIPRQLRETPATLAAFQKRLADDGVLLGWPADAARAGG